MSLSSMIDRIRLRPGAFLGRNHITPLNHLINGYKMAESEYHIEVESNELLPLDFRYMSAFVNSRFNIRNSMGWCNSILEHCSGDEEKALDEFFRFYDEFRCIKLKKYHKALLSEENIRYNDSMEHGYISYGFSENERKPIFCRPIAAYIIELDVPAYIAAVETDTEINSEFIFFDSWRSALSAPGGIEAYFGKIENWQEFIAENINFGKPVRRK